MHGWMLSHVAVYLSVYTLLSCYLRVAVLYFLYGSSKPQSTIEVIIVISNSVRLGLLFIKTTIIVADKLVVYRLTGDPVNLSIPCCCWCRRWTYQLDCCGTSLFWFHNGPDIDIISNCCFGIVLCVKSFE